MTVAKVGYLVVSRNNERTILQCLLSIVEQNYTAKKIYLLDNCSEDLTVELVEKIFPDVFIIKSKSNLGFAASNNQLVRLALTDKTIKYLALVNSDAELEKNWTKLIVEFAETTVKGAGFQGLTLKALERDKVDSHHLYVRQNLQSIQFGFELNKNLIATDTREVFGVNAAAAIYSRAFIENEPQQNLFEEKFFMYLEDVDVAFRAQLSGWRNYHVNGAVAYHLGSGSSKRYGFNWYMTCRNQPALILRNLPSDLTYRCLKSALKFEPILYHAAYKEDGIRLLLKVILGRVVGLLRLPLYLRDRKRIQKLKSVPSSQIANYFLAEGEPINGTKENQAQ